MQFLTLSFTHKNTDISTREKLSFGSQDKLYNALKIVVNHENINEAIILSTCNRVEIITSVKEYESALDYVFRTLSFISGLSRDELESKADVYEGNGAIHHLFAVGASLDSLVVGETQISGQLKNAFNFAYENGFCGAKLSRAMHHCFKCAATVRSSTDISKNPVSVASVAVAKAKDLLGSLNGKDAVVVGAGEMSQLSAKHLIGAGANVIIINRNHENAVELAETLGENASALPFSMLSSALNQYSLLFSATGAPHTVITNDMVEARDFERYWFDIAVPRDIEPCKFDNVHICAVDDLEEIVTKNLALREEQARIAYSIVAENAAEFFKHLQTLLVDPIIKEIRDRAKNSALAELERAVKKGYIAPEAKESVEKILHHSFNSFLHRPTVKLKKVSTLPEADAIVQAIQYFFDISDEQIKNLNAYKSEHHLENNE